MAGFADLVLQGQPALYGGGCTGSGTEGATWRWRFIDVKDNAGTLVNLLTGVTGTCQILTAIDGTVVATPTVTGTADGKLTVELDETLTAALATGITTAPRRCVWRCTLTNGTDTVQVWHPMNSHFYIYPAA